jgi:hypothetical protein
MKKASKVLALLPILLFFYACHPGPRGGEVKKEEIHIPIITTVYLLIPGSSLTDSLTPEGEKYQSIALTFRNKNIDGIYTADKKPFPVYSKFLSTNLKTTLQTYSTNNIQEIRNLIEKHHIGETIIVEAHHQNFYPLLESLGLKNIWIELPDSQSPSLFKIEITDDFIQTEISKVNK